MYVFLNPSRTRNSLQGLPSQGLDSSNAGAMQVIMAAVCLYTQTQTSPTGKNAGQETHSLFFTCIKTNKFLASTFNLQKRAQILKSTYMAIYWVSSSCDVPPRQIFHSTQDYRVPSTKPDPQALARYAESRQT